MLHRRLSTPSAAKGNYYAVNIPKNEHWEETYHPVQT